jgi:hemimethylated DNA binding protein
LGDQPSYLCLIDSRDRLIPQIGYVAQENIDLAAEGVSVRHAFLDKYFERFDGKAYVPRPWLKVCTEASYELM